MREREAIRFCTCGCCDDDSETAFFRLAPDDEDTGVAMGDEPVDSRRVEPDLMECYAFRGPKTTWEIMYIFLPYFCSMPLSFTMDE